MTLVLEVEIQVLTHQLLAHQSLKIHQVLEQTH
jgi:hypothetical protein